MAVLLTVRQQLLEDSYVQAVITGTIELEGLRIDDQERRRRIAIADSASKIVKCLAQILARSGPAGL